MTTTATDTDAGYDDLGTGEPALLMLPGWCGNRDVFDGVAARLAETRRVLVCDLRGQGGFVDETADLGSSRQVRDLLTRLDRLGVERVVPVTLSHAGWFGIELRRRLGAVRVPGLALIDWMVLGTPPGFAEVLSGLQQPTSWEQVRGSLFDRWTDGVADPAVHQYVEAMAAYGFDQWSLAAHEIAASFATDGNPLAALSGLDEPCPTLHLYAQPGDDAYLAAQQAAADELGWFRVDRLDATSHFPMLEVPAEVAARIERFVAGLGVGR